MISRNHLALFRAVAEAGGFSRAAEVIHVSQPAISMQVAELEDNLGAPLFERLPRGVRLTLAGETLLVYAQRIAALEQEAERSMGELRGLKRGRLAVGASQTIGVYLLPELLGCYHKRNPGIELEATVANTEIIKNRLFDGTLDVGLTEGENPGGDQDLTATVFHEDELVAIAPVDHPLMSKSRLTVKVLCEQGMIVRESGSGTRAVIDKMLAKRGLSFKRVIMSLGSTEAIKRAVGAGLGLAIVSRLAVGRELATNELGVLTVRDLKLRRPLHRLTLRNRPLSVAAEAFFTLLKPSDAS